MSIRQYIIMAGIAWGAMGAVFGTDIIKASSFGFQADNATECLQKAIDSGAKTIMVDNTGSDWVVDRIKLRSDLELVFADGVVVKALPGAFKGRNDCLFEARDSKNLILRGEGTVRLVMNKKDYQNAAAYQWSEWRHLISLRGCENVTISNLTLESSGGDGIYISTSSKMPGCRNVLIENVIALNHHRQGISVISADKLVIRNSKFNNTSGTPPTAGIDFEPNKANEWISNCLVENCEFNNNGGAGIMLHLNPLKADSRSVSVLFKNCSMSGNASGFMINASSTTPVKGQIILENCRMINNRGNELLINEQQENGLEIIIKDCTLDSRESNSKGIVISTKKPDDVSGIRFEDVRIFPGKQTPVSFLSLSGSGLKDLTGNITVGGKDFNLERFVAANKPNSQLKQFAVEQVDMKNLKPIGSKSENGLPNGRFRKRFKFLQYVEKGKELPMKFTALQVGKSPLRIQVAVTDSNGTPIDEFIIREPSYTYMAKPKGNSDVWMFDVNAGPHTLSFDYGAPGQAILADTPVGMFRGSKHKFYFMVPAGVQDIAIEVSPDVNEPVSSQLIDPNGKIVISNNRSATAKLLKHSRTDASKDEIWCVYFPYVREDFRFRIGSPLLPLVSTAPENLLITR